MRDCNQIERQADECRDSESPVDRDEHPESRRQNRRDTIDAPCPRKAGWMKARQAPETDRHRCSELLVKAARRQQRDPEQNSKGRTPQPSPRRGFNRHVGVALAWDGSGRVMRTDTLYRHCSQRRWEVPGRSRFASHQPGHNSRVLARRSQDSPPLGQRRSR